MSGRTSFGRFMSLAGACIGNPAGFDFLGLNLSFSRRKSGSSNKKTATEGLRFFLFRYALSFLVEEIHRPFGADRGERENRVAEVFESFGHRLALFVVPVPQYVVHLVSAREVAADAEADAAVLLRASSSVMFFSPLCPPALPFVRIRKVPNGRAMSSTTTSRFSRGIFSASSQ